ncbi:MAG: putative rRNA maturation factor YbeY [Rhodobacteraceae bacterium HLUCCA12]|nr:MAG: putative rRNA maturation factor YbeY [Rhodobacteraceae bacterium HLUCCA12]
MPVDVNTEDDRWGDLEPLARRSCAAALRYLGYDPALFEISILACNDARIQTLNAQFRGKDRPTNVLSWPAWDLAGESPGAAPAPPEPGTPDMPEALGDLALAWETCEGEAREQGKKLDDHVAHLMVHSVLHLLGYDHEHAADAHLMEETEAAILATMGIADPYSSLDGPPDDAADTVETYIGKV